MSKQQLLDEIRLLQKRADELEKAELANSKEKTETITLASDENIAAEAGPPADSDEHIDAKELMNQIRSQVENNLSFDESSKQQLAEILKEVEQQFEQLPKKACLAVFTAGILLGKFLR